MATSIALILLLGFIVNGIFNKIKLPGLLGMLILGVIIGPYELNLLSNSILTISPDIRKIALIIILLRAGLGINKRELKEVGITAIKFSCIPGIIEGLFIAIICTKLLGFTFIEGGILGFIIAAVSPAVIVPSMLELIENKIGTNKGIPTIILAGASIDDVFAITIFTSFLSMYGGNKVNLGLKVLEIPLSILLGILLGIIVSIVLLQVFKIFEIRDTKKVLLVLASAILLNSLEGILKDKIEIATLLGVMTIGFVITEKNSAIGKVLSDKFNKMWIFAEIFLFVLVGAQVNISVAIDAGLLGILIILFGLLGRSIGVFICTIGTNLNLKERLFCVIAYIPKATVQAAIGAVPLSAGVASGDIMLAIAFLSILITAPLGAIGVKISSNKFLDTEEVIKKTA
ncbi:sodium/hydrogen exchanger family protein [Clostridium argentinense CDC 2741]|uniref:Sodium/hydrogen exchanger family protein n=1 Tax=Clostridium argentinense CDC 2741 TaxID=1418104 RepID=A0A0C1TZZ2_9CLOT|nr:cation:proton antiporter [Clostridium argentinense]ARC85868.1 potassium transporter [Clostridium argentinense]KIE46159.1 sodium/hydrogen exchanger family protein [Clostridium argentinense CDC 2741]NFF39955.1 sodium:proton antiporter [Clostridium argentinense]NFP48586.1 sodium:proton antiporter [Clostridium argentinense]NFP71146.1 sodium:proton antiporter [Clostridium argentinense]